MYELVEFCIRHMTHVPCSPTTYKTLSSVTETRAQLCARVAELTTPLLMHLHDAQSVEQINGTPDGAVCAVTGKELTPKLGVQLKFNKYHVCVHPEVMDLLYHYFCIRHFPLWMAGRVRSWLLDQTWFHRHIDADKHKTIHAVWEPIAQRDFDTSMAFLQSFVHRCAQKRGASLH